MKTVECLRILAIVGAGLPAFAQSVNGTLTGIVTDPADAVIVNATVSARDRATGITTTTRTTAAGAYSLSLRPGVYEVMVELPGFRTSVSSNLEVNIGQTTRFDIRLQVGEVTERVTVEATAPLISMETSELGAVVRSQTVLDLPLSTPGQRRMADTFTLLIPGVTTGAGSGGSYANLQWDRGGQWQTNGSQENSREVLYDGISIGEIHSPGRFWAGSPPPDSIQEFKMLTGSYSAEYGRSAGGIITLTTRSGGNDFHGSAYNFLRNEKLHARGFFAPSRQKDIQNEFGATFGGPVRIPKLYDGRNRTFFYAFYNGLRWRTSSANELVTVPRPEFLQGDFSGLLDARGQQRIIYDPRTSRRLPNGDIERDPFPGNRIPADRISPVSRNVAALLPAPTLPGQTRNFVGVRSTISDDNRWQAKLDHVLNEQHRLSGLYSWGKFVRDGSGPLPDRIFSGFTTRDERAHLARVAHDWMIGPTLVNRLSFGFNRDAPFTGSPTVGEGWPARLGLQGTGDDAGGAFPRINFGSEVDDGVGLGGEANSYQAESSFIVSNVMTKIAGRHSMRFGGDFRYYQLNARVFHRTHGTFNFGSGFTSNPASPN
ncbi:MAG: carboxypeptidase regulatory-like domain-containing protein, partial [Bryobacteraceae bacterium]